MTWAHVPNERSNAVFTEELVAEIRAGRLEHPGEWKKVREYRSHNRPIPKHPTDIELMHRYRVVKGQRVTELWARALPKPEPVPNGPDAGHATGRRKPADENGAGLGRPARGIR